MTMYLLDGTDFFYCAKMAESGADVVRREVTGLGRTKRREAVILRFILQDEETSLSHAISKEELIDEPCLLLHRCWESLYAGKCSHQNCGWSRDGKGGGSCCYINGGQ